MNRRDSSGEHRVLQARTSGHGDVDAGSVVTELLPLVRLIADTCAVSRACLTIHPAQGPADVLAAVELPETLQLAALGLAEHALAAGGLLHVPHLAGDERRRPPHFGVWRAIASYAGAAAPLADGRGHVVLSLMHVEPHTLGSGALLALRTVARQAATVIEASRLRGDLAVAEARYRLLFDYTPEGILIADARSVYLDANAGMCRMLGYARDELVGRHAVDIVASSEIPNIAPALDTLQAGAEHTREWLFRRKDGSEFRAEVRATAMPDGRLLATIRDVTERRRIEARFRRLVDSNAHGVHFWTLAGAITGANDAFLQLVGYSREDLHRGLVGWKDLTPPEYADRDARAIDEIAAHGVCRPYEKEFIRRDGTRVPVLVGAASFEDARDEGVCYVVDLQERKALERQFLRAQRLESLGTLAGGIAHDLNNVLAPILLSVDVLKDLARDAADRALVASVQASAERAAALVRQVLSFARGVEARRAPTSATALVRELVGILRDTLPKSIRILSVVSDDVWTVIGDDTQLHQVLLNLAVNARDAMPQGGTLTIEAQNLELDAGSEERQADAVPGPYVRIQVTDTGVGIPPESRDRVFDPFFTTKQVGKGTGLGLSTSLGIVRSHGGFIRLQSTPGQGSTFAVYLPASPGVPPDQAVNARHSIPHGQGETVLVIDDEEPIRQHVQYTLERFGYRVIVAANGAEAVAAYARHGGEIAVVLTDVAMPVMDGPATIAALRALDPALPIIVSSGLVPPAEDVAAGDPPLTALPKPYRTADLLEAVAAAVAAGRRW
jgi:PAS domain S-box-containing protein